MNSFASNASPASFPAPQSEPRWQPYLKAAVFMAPALLLWGFSAVFLFPKIKQIWVDGGFFDVVGNANFVATSHLLMRTSDYLTENGLLIGACSMVALILLEWRNGFWQRHRNGFLSVGIFCVNAGVLFLLTTMLTAVLMVAPALLRGK